MASAPDQWSYKGWAISVDAGYWFADKAGFDQVRASTYEGILDEIEDALGGEDA